MGNCLVKKLQSVVEDENLKKLNEIKFYVSDNLNNVLLNTLFTSVNQIGFRITNGSAKIINTSTNEEFTSINFNSVSERQNYKFQISDNDISNVFICFNTNDVFNIEKNIGFDFNDIKYFKIPSIDFNYTLKYTNCMFSSIPKSCNYLICRQYCDFEFGDNVSNLHENIEYFMYNFQQKYIDNSVLQRKKKTKSFLF